jgi:uncharacterized repeat protein (TIGR02059 family)
MLSNKLTLILLLSGFFILTTCKKVEKVMMVKTGVASNITTNSADVSGQIIDIGEEATQYGHCYAKTPNVNKNNLITEKGKPTGNVSFTSSLTNLEPGTKYYVKAYISNKDGLTIYGDEIDLITLQHAIPEYISSVVENSTPTLLEMTYSLTLANIVPAASAFIVQVNSAGRTVNAVAISGNKVQLTLASAVVYGDIVTVAYIRPGSNPLQTLSGGQAASIAAQAVTNHVSPPIPVYVSSVVENATPTLLEMIYSLTLANIVPATSAFTVQVNSVGRTINTVVISGTKVLLTLSSPVVYGDIVTVAYTKPATNPLQTATGGQAVTISGQTVTNNTLCNAPSANTNVATDRGSSTVTFNGTVNANGSSTAVTFEYGTTISYGSEISATQSPITGTSNTSVNALVDGLIPFTVYHYRVKAINCGGTIYGPDIIFKTLCPSSLTLTHTAGSVAPVTKEVTYRIVQTSLTGEDKCWITQNLGADSQAGSEIDNTQAAAGWYWQFNRKQGYKYDGTRTPATTWITNISENSNWTLANDPCNQLLGSGWRIPTSMEWTMANNNGGWNNWFDTYSSVLKLHAQEGYLVSDLGTPSFLASYGYYWSTSENLYNYGWCLYFFGNESNILAESKAWGLSIRCLKD